MVTTVPAEEILAIVHATHKNPHKVLGMHTAEVLGRSVPVVRVFAPRARAVWVIEQADEQADARADGRTRGQHAEPPRRHPMDKVHDQGLFEAIFIDRDAPFSYTLELHEGDGEGDGHRVETADTYGISMDAVTEFDRYLFNRATHYRIYDKMGAHLGERDGVAGVHFAVWAPNAQRVSVVGDFNSWDGRAAPMKLHEDSGVWELFIPGLHAGQIYKYELKARDGRVLLKTDPYAGQFELRPRTGSIVARRPDFQWRDDDWLERRKRCDWRNEPVLIYEVHPGSWRRRVEEDNRWLGYRELADELIPYVKDMGYTHIELMGILEYPFDGSWGYQVTGYFAPTSRHGDPEEFMAFVDRCHREGIGVLLDWVPGHFPRDEHALAEFDGSALYEHEDPRLGEHPDWGTKIFNYGRFEVANFLISNALFWVDRYHLDGLRVDAVASMLYLDYSREEGQWIPNRYGGRENLEAVEFLTHLNSIVRQYEPGVMIIAEESTSWPMVTRAPEEGGLGFYFKWNMGWMHDVLTYMRRDPIHRRHHHDELTFTMIYAHSESYVLPFSHDEVVHGKGSLIGRMPGDRWQKFANLRLLYSFMYAFPGKVLSFMGNEFAQFDEWSHERSLDWHLLDFDMHRGVHDMVRDLNRLAVARPELHARDVEPGGFQWINGADAENSVWTFIRWGHHGDAFLVVAVNFTPVVRRDYRIGVPRAGVYREIFNSDAGVYGGGDVGSLPTRSHEERLFGFEYSLGITIPPLGAVFLECAGD